MEPPCHPTSAFPGIHPRATGTYVHAKKKKEKGYTSIHNSSTQNSKILETKCSSTMGWLNQRWQSRIGNITQPRKGRNGPSTQPPGRVSRAACNQSTSRGHTLSDFISTTFSKQDDQRWRADRRFPGNRKWRGERAPENGFWRRRSLGIGEGTGYVKPRVG